MWKTAFKKFEVICTGYLPEILLGPFLNTLSFMNLYVCSHLYYIVTFSKNSNIFSSCSSIENVRRTVKEIVLHCFSCNMCEYIWQTKNNVAGVDIFDNKGKGQISKQVLQENKARRIFWKINFFTPHTRACVYEVTLPQALAQGFPVNFSKFLRAPFFQNTHRMTISVLK